ncbi:MAG TPA: amino acid adenylation domain-containing protein [Terriglobales bacterium]|nr:amino acid adenylation domain-containing protein [Terriglobales bacterium]
MRPWLLTQAVAGTVARRPEAPALRDGKVELSYGALWQESGRLAAGLQALGLGPGERAGICLKKSAAAGIAILAVLRAGGAYVPLDPVAPPARLAALIRDCGLRVVIAGDDQPGVEELRRAAAESPVRHWVTATGAAPGWRGVELGIEEPAPRRRVGGDLAYVLYTSGSTGQPKGVMHCHRHALNFIEWAAEETALGEQDRVGGFAPLHFDLSIFDLFASWSRGACLCMLDAVTARFPAAMAAWLDQERISVLYCVPSALVRLLPRCDPERGGANLRSLRAVIFAGEVFPVAPLRAWVARLPQTAFYNWYGPTETNVCTAYRVPSAPELIPDPLPIGTACPNFELRAGDESGQPSPDGAGYLWARGEIFLGYWGDRQRTAQVCRPFAGADGLEAVWYNTGDLARLDGDGVWHFEGRRDDLVKVRGYRISLLEIQQTLLRAPAVAAAAVLLIGEPGGEALHAYVALQAGQTASAAEVRNWCSQTLPRYMVPEVHVVAQLPETATGKVDRVKLAELARQGAAA